MMAETFESVPRLSVGLAVYNGEEYLEEAIDSILAQTLTDFELIICDNASNDRTQQICELYRDSESRVRYFRNPTNIGGANNENLTFTHARAKYFRWAAHDDICAPSLFERCLEVMENDEQAVLCYTRIIEIDGSGDITGASYQRRGTARTASERFRELVFRDHRCEATYGVVRSDVLRAVGPQRNYTDSDRVLLCALALRGHFIQLDEGLFYKRHHRKNAYNDWRARMTWFNPGKPLRISFPNWLQAGHLVVTVVNAPVPLGERVRCLGWVGVWIIRYARKLAGDIVYSLRSILTPRSRRPVEDWRYNWE